MFGATLGHYRIVDKLEVKLLGGERAAVTRRHTDDLEAHNAYLMGLFEWNKMTPGGFARCQELFQEAIDLDPDFAPPYAQLADSFSSVTWWADLAPAGALAKALPLVEKAVELSGGTSVTQCNLAMICYHIGERQEGDALFDCLRRRARETYVSPSSSPGSTSSVASARTRCSASRRRWPRRTPGSDRSA